MRAASLIEFLAAILVVAGILSAAYTIDQIEQTAQETRQ